MKAENRNNTSGGLHKDNAPIYQPEGSITFALNAVPDTEIGDVNSISTEQGNKRCYDLPSGYTPIGHIPMMDNEVVVFSTDGTNSEIGIAKRCKYTKIDNTTCLNFNLQYGIKGEFRLLKGCERVIYFYDGFNEDKTLNLDRIDDFKSSGHLDCSKMALSPHYTIPNIYLESVNDSGGFNVDIGSYKFALRYVTDSNNATDFVKISDAIPIYDDAVGNAFNALDGAYPLSAGFSADVGGKPATNKSISLRFENVDTKFDKLQISAIRYNNGDGVTKSSFIVDTIPITGSTINWTYIGFDPNTVTQINNADIQINRQIYNTSRAITRVGNRLLRSHVTEKKINWAKFQQASNNILSSWFTENTPAYDTTARGNIKNPFYYFDKTSYMRDEVYAFGIIYEFKDGTESPVFHIPGRVADTDARISIAQGNLNVHHRNLHPGTSANWDTQSLSVISSGTPTNTQIHIDDVEHIANVSSIPRWKVYNTAIIDSSGTSGIMGYHENETAYPDDKDCDDNRVYPEGNIRHHRMPDSTLMALMIQTNPTGANIGFGEGATLRNLGVRFTNIVPPVEYANDVVGWRIVRAERDEFNKTVLDKGMYFNTYGWSYNGTLLQQYTRHGRIISAVNKISGILTNNNNNLNATNAFIPLGTIEGYADCFAGRGVINLSINQTGSNGNVYSFISPETRIKDKYPQSTYLKYENTLTGTFNTFIKENPTGVDYQAHGTEFIKNPVVAIRHGQPNHAVNRVVSDLVSLPFNSELSANGLQYSNISQQKRLMFTSKALNPANVLNDTTGSTWEGPPKTNNIQDVSGYYISLKQWKANVYEQIENLKYVQTSNVSFNTSTVSVFGGDVFIGIHEDRETFHGSRCRTTGTEILISRNLLAFPTESHINMNLRHHGENDSCRNYVGHTFNSQDKVQSSNNRFNNTIAKINDERVRNMFREYVYKFNDNDDERPLCENFYAYNDDYSVLNDFKVFFAHQLEWCDDCQHLHRNRIAWSEPASDEDNFDAFRSYLANNYKEVGSHTGPITNLYAQNNRELYVTTEQSLFKLFANSQEIQTNVDAIQIGTGSFLSLPEVEIAKTDYGYAGNQGRFNMEVTDKGAFYVDQRSGKVYQIAQNIRTISDTGLHQWFKHNLPSEFAKQYYDHTGVDYPYKDAIHHPSGIGVHAVYDPEFERYIIHKRDYEITDIDALLAALNFQTINESVASGSADIDLSTTPNVTTTTYSLGPGVVSKTGDYIIDFQLKYASAPATPSDVKVEIRKNGQLYKTLVRTNADTTRWALHADINSDFEADGYKEVDYFKQGDSLTLTLTETNPTGIQITNATFSLVTPFQERKAQLLSTTNTMGTQTAYTLTTDCQLNNYKQDQDDPVAQCTTVIDTAGTYDITATINAVIQNGPTFSHTVRVNDIPVGPVGNTFTMQLNANDVVDIYSVVSSANGTLNHTSAKLVMVNRTYLPNIVDIPDEFLRKKSWTLSYSTKHQRWSSWHSYMPRFWYNDNETFYSTSTNKIWSHDNREHCEFYGNDYAHIVEFVIPSPHTSTLESVQWIARTQSWDDTNQCWVTRSDSTYDGLVAYNSCQTTAGQELSIITNPYETVTWNNLAKKVSLNDDHFKTAQIRDLSTATGAMMTADPALAQYTAWFDSTGNGYIDKVPNPAVYDVNKPLHQQAMLRDKYFFVRLFFTQHNNYKLTLDLMNTMNKYSIR